MRVRILLVDDDRVTREAMATLLRSEGFEVITAATGHEALGELARERFEVLVTDIKMPGLSGEELLTTLPPGRVEVSLVVSGYDSPGPEVCAQLGIAEWLEKPVEIEVLVHAILSRLTARAGRGGGAASGSPRRVTLQSGVRPVRAAGGPSQMGGEWRGGRRSPR